MGAYVVREKADGAPPTVSVMLGLGVGEGRTGIMAEG